MMWIGVLWLAAGSLSAQTVSLNTSTSLSEPCASAKAVHDMRCSNYTGFTARLGGSDGAPAADTSKSDASDTAALADDAAKPRLEAVLRREKRKVTGSRVGFVGTLTIIPFTVIALSLVLGLILGPANGRYRRRGAIVVGVAVALVALNFAWIYPVLTDGLLIHQTEYLARMWLRSWI